MTHRSIVEKRFYASALMTAILLLYIALASISPFKLTADISPNGVGSYIRAMDITSGNALSSNIENRMRARSMALLAVSVIAQEITGFNRDVPFSSTPLFNSYRLWDRLVGCASTAMPRADMVELK